MSNGQAAEREGRMFQAERARGKRKQHLFRDPISERAWLEERGEVRLLLCWMGACDRAGI